jgi:AraC family transcriptional regulator
MNEINRLTTPRRLTERSTPLPQRASRKDDRRPHIATDASWVDGLRNHDSTGDSEDRVMRSLSSALEAAVEERDRHCADTLRLAIAIRLCGLRLKAIVPAKEGDFDPKTRRARALQPWRLKRVVEYADNRLPAKIGLSDLASVAGLSRMHFASQFRAATGLRPHEFLLRRRVQRAEALLRNSPMAIADIALTVGFQTQAHFATVFKKIIGCTPRQWRMINQTPIAPQPGNGLPIVVTARGLSGAENRLLWDR